jgi:hypothetical protein
MRQALTFIPKSHSSSGRGVVLVPDTECGPGHPNVQ